MLNVMLSAALKATIRCLNPIELTAESFEAIDEREACAARATA